MGLRNWLGGEWLLRLMTQKVSGAGVRNSFAPRDALKGFVVLAIYSATSRMMEALVSDSARNP
jgi:hypothetical protein